MEQKLKADAEGFLHFTSTQSGLHLLGIARHRTTIGGFAGGRAYNLTGRKAQLRWSQPWEWLRKFECVLYHSPDLRI
jgi:hypothetical protein